jgi:DNA-binding MarR family transcriptional regulator
MSMIVDVTRTIEAFAADAPVPQDALMDTIIADCHQAFVAIKCAGNESLLRLGVSMAQINIMYSLLRGGEMPMSRLAEVLNVSLSNATGLIDRLEERHYIERTRVPEDRRIVMVRLTDTGVKLLEDQGAMTDDLLRAILGRLRPAQLSGVAQAASDLRDAVESAMGPLPDRQPFPHAAPRTTSTTRGADVASGDPRPTPTSL